MFIVWGLLSIPMLFLFSCWATAWVVPDPLWGSRIVSPGLLLAVIILRSMPSGFCVG